MVDLQILETYKKDLKVINRKRRLIYLRNRTLMVCIFVLYVMFSMWPLAFFHPDRCPLWIMILIILGTNWLVFWILSTHDRLNNFLNNLMDHERELVETCRSLEFYIKTMELFSKPLPRQEKEQVLKEKKLKAERFLKMKAILTAGFLMRLKQKGLLKSKTLH